MKVLIVDGTNQFIRNYTVVPTLSPHGNRNGGVFGFLTTLSSLLKYTKPDKMIVVWDGAGGSQKRRKILKDYKSNRKPIEPARINRNFEFEDQDPVKNMAEQRLRLAQYLGDLPVYQVTVDNIEADDVIGYLCRKYSSDEKVIASSDKDFYQLLSDKTMIFKPKSKQFFNTQDCLDKFGIYPCNFALARAFVGDPSDNLQGIKGVGFKTLLKFLPFFGEEKELTIEEVFEYIKKQEDEKYKRFEDSQDIVINNYEVMQLKKPIISFHSIQKIEDFLEKELKCNSTSFRLKLKEDGINTLSDSYVSFFNPLYLNRGN